MECGLKEQDHLFERKEELKVSILVLMECGLKVRAGSMAIQIASCFNPCFNGMRS